MDVVFNSLEELYERIKPALTTKRREMHRNGFNYIKEDDIWNFLKEVKWKSSSSLALHEMVRDVLNCDNDLIDNYLKTKLNLRNRRVYFETSEE
ncbi:MAG: post-transcriptional regulator [Bacilli bacterium]|nr:post-transcriptional regulator [Bacilli bacterium]MDD4282803.1 post-transcriptional regulator [Bacilli bacterium]MDD4718882.1 post-transcriptional regulator [Bacilli bacterium]